MTRVAAVRWSPISEGVAVGYNLYLLDDDDDDVGVQRYLQSGNLEVWRGGVGARDA